MKMLSVPPMGTIASRLLCSRFGSLYSYIRGGRGMLPKKFPEDAGAFLCFYADLRETSSLSRKRVADNPLKVIPQSHHIKNSLTPLQGWGINLHLLIIGLHPMLRSYAPSGLIHFRQL